MTRPRGRSRPTFTPRPFLQIHHTYLPHCLPCCTAAGFGYVDPNIPCPPTVNNPQPCLPCPQPYVLPPLPPHNQEASAKSSPQSLLMLRRVTPLK